MNYYTAKAECDRLNRQIVQANLRYANMVHVPEFCRQSSGNCLVFGGSPELRNEFSAEKVLAEARKCQYPVIVLTSSELLFHRLRQEAENHSVDAVITSRKYPNYEFFRGWSRTRIAEFFEQISSDASSGFYANAFLDILFSSRQPVTLKFMRELAGHTDAEIALIGRNVHAPAHAINVVANYSQEANLFRSDLYRFCAAVKDLVPGGGRGYSLSEPSLENGVIYLIDIHSPHANLLNQYFAEELRQILSASSQVLVFYTDVNLNQGSPLLDVLTEAQALGAMIGVSVESAGSIRERSLRFRTNILLMDETEDNQRLEADLKTFGSGNYFYPRFNGRSMIRWKLSNAWEVGTVLSRNWVPIGNASGMRAILQGDRGNQVTLARNLSLPKNY